MFFIPLRLSFSRVLILRVCAGFFHLVMSKSILVVVSVVVALAIAVNAVEYPLHDAALKGDVEYSCFKSM